MGLRSLLYKAAALLGDVNAMQKNKIPQRIVRRQVYKASSNIAGKICRKLFK